MIASPYLTAIEATEYTRRPTLRAFYSWARRHGIAIGGGLVLRSDLDRVIDYQRTRQAKKFRALRKSA